MPAPKPGAGSEFIEIHASSVTAVRSRFVAAGTETNAPRLKLKPLPTSPDAKAAPFCSVPLLPPRMSLALPLPCHQLTSPLGSGSHLHTPNDPLFAIAWISAGVSARL